MILDGQRMSSKGLRQSSGCCPGSPRRTVRGSYLAQQGDVLTWVLSHRWQGVTFRFIQSNGITTAHCGGRHGGRWSLLAHGWPESWYSWRHQMTMLADAGYHVVAPDMRGYGEADKPAAVDDYDITPCGRRLGEVFWMHLGEERRRSLVGS